MERSNPLEALLRAVEAGDLKAARAAAESLSRGPAHNPVQLAAEVLHELRQPLLGIKGYLQMLADDDGPNAQTVPLVLAQVERMEQIVSDFTRLATNRPAPKERLSLAAHVRAAHAFSQRNAEQRATAELEVLQDSELHGNGRLVEQLVLNLINNARDAMGGRGRIKVVVGRDGGAPVLYVADWGPGIAPEIRERLFEPYVTSKQRGSGLGLAVCKRIAEEHGATIDLAPSRSIAETPPPATVFRVRFPIDASETAATARKHILVVDDESIIRSIFRDLLGKECDVVQAETAEEALGQLRSGARFDLIVTDKNLPGLSGMELAQEARRLDPNSRVMVMTGYPSLVTAQQALELGVVDYLLKPFDDIRQVREKIRSVLAAGPQFQAASPRATRRVDVYEDNEQSARSISEALTLLGLEPRILSEPVPGGDDVPAGVVVSWNFGPASGTNALALGKSMSRGAPFIVLVEHLSMDTTLEALRAGCAACLPKLLSDSRAMSRELSRALRAG